MSATSEAPAAFRHAAARPGPGRLLGEAIQDVRSRRRLVRYLVQADIRKKGADTFFGNLWWIIDPLLQMLVYVVFVGLILQRDTPDYPLFILAAILPWKWFTTSVSDAASAVTSQEKLIKQIQFPKIVLPVAATTAGIVGFGFGLLPLLAIVLVYDRLSAFLLLIPIIAAVQYLFTLGVAFLVSAVNVFFRDLGNVLRHVLRLWFYLSPGMYSLSLLDSTAIFLENPVLSFIAHANPIAILFEAYRAVVYGGPDGSPPLMPDWTGLLVLAAASCILIALTAIFFKRLEPQFAKVL